MILSGKLQPQSLVYKTIPLAEAPAELQAMSQFGTLGTTVIDNP
jgi:hypothetical protein